MSSNVYARNINALAQKDFELAKKLTDFVMTEQPQLVQENGFYNFIYKNTHLHNPQNPLMEAKEIFAQAENTPVAIHLIYGIGLGYLFQVASAESKGTVILYEPDLNVLKTAFMLVDFSADILKKNVFIAENLDKASEYIYQKSNMKNTPLLLSLPAARALDEDGFNTLVGSLQTLVGRFSLDLNYTKERFYRQLRLLIRNIPNLVNETPLIKIKDGYKGKTAVVVSAGPTLDRNIETIKKYRDNILLLVVGTAAKTLAKHEIKPDYLCIIESYDSSKQIEGLNSSDVNLITEPYSHFNLRKFNFKHTYSHISANMPINILWSEICGENIEEYWSKGTVSYTAMNAARILGCSKIVLVGQDLAYIDGQCYSKDSAYKDLICSYNENFKRWEISAKDFDAFAKTLCNNPDADVRRKSAQKRLVDLNSSLHYVKGITGDMIPTESVYAAFIQPLTEFTEKFSEIEYINTSLVGAQIDGFTNMPLEEALKDSTLVETRDIESDFKYDVSKIVENLKRHLSILEQIAPKIEEGARLIKGFKNDLKRYRAVTVELLKSLKKLSVNYLDLSTNYKNTFFDYITASERINMDYVMKMTSDFNLEALKEIEEKASAFYSIAQERSVALKELVDEILKELA